MILMKYDREININKKLVAILVNSKNYKNKKYKFFYKSQISNTGS